MESRDVGFSFETLSEGKEEESTEWEQVDDSSLEQNEDWQDEFLQITKDGNELSCSPPKSIREDEVFLTECPSALNLMDNYLKDVEHLKLERFSLKVENEKVASTENSSFMDELQALLSGTRPFYDYDQEWLGVSVKNKLPRHSRNAKDFVVPLRNRLKYQTKKQYHANYNRNDHHVGRTNWSMHRREQRPFERRFREKQ